MHTVHFISDKLKDDEIVAVDEIVATETSFLKKICVQFTRLCYILSHCDSNKNASHCLGSQ